MKNCWYVAGWSHEIDADSLFARTICNKRIVFWRDEAGTLHAMDDRCCHRGAPLSVGRKEGDNVRCMYHGFLFDTAGCCIEIPGYDKIPPKARVRTYAVAERHRWVWLWMGDPAQADEALIPDTHWLEDPDWTCTRPGHMHYQVNYQLVNDNLLDFSHLSYVHPETLGGSEEYAQLRPQIERLPRGLRITRWFMDRPPAPFVAKLLQAKGMTGNVDRWNNYDFLLPGVLIMDSGFAPAGSGAQNGNRQEAIEFRHCQVVTPETENSCNYFFAQPRNFDRDSADVSEALYASIIAAFEEDRRIITAQQESLAADPSFEPVACGLDSALGQFRWMIEHQINQERQAEAAAQDSVVQPVARAL